MSVKRASEPVSWQEQTHGTVVGSVIHKSQKLRESLSHKYAKNCRVERESVQRKGLMAGKRTHGTVDSGTHESQKLEENLSHKYDKKIRKTNCTVE